MATGGFKKKSDNKPNPIIREEEIQQNPDPKIDQDFPGFPHAPANKKNIKPATQEEKKSAGVKPPAEKNK